jgi:hypothetical protein
VKELELEREILHRAAEYFTGETLVGKADSARVGPRCGYLAGRRLRRKITR